MKTYTVVIPSHTDAPDFEREIQANSKEEAVDFLALLHDIDKEYVLEHCIQEQKEESKE